MLKPESIKIDPWTDFPRADYSLLTDDFVHDKLATVKVNSKGLKSTFNVKASVKSDKAGYSLSDEVKFWFALPKAGRSLFAKIKSNNYLKLHFDNGYIEQFDKKWNLYGTLNCNKALENLSLRLGAAHISKHCNSDNRLKIDFHNGGRNNLTFYNRTLVNHEKLYFGLMAAYNITSNILVKNNVLLGYQVNPTSNAYVRLENRGFRKDAFNWADLARYFDTARIDFISTHNLNVKYGVEAVVNFHNEKGSPLEEALFVVQHVNLLKNWVTKARISSKFDVSLSFKYPSILLQDIGTTTIGLHGSNLQSDNRNLKFGIQLECNV